MGLEDDVNAGINEIGGKEGDKIGNDGNTSGDGAAGGEIKRSRSKLVRRVRGVTTGVFIVLFVLFTLYSLAAYSVPPTETVVHRSLGYSERGLFEHHGAFSDESVYGNGTAVTYYPSGITEEIYGTYGYSNSRKTGGNYSVELAIRYYVQSGRRKIYMKNDSLWKKEGLITGGRFSAPVRLDLDAINSNVSAVRKGLGLPRLSAEIYLLVKAYPSGLKPFEHRIYLMKDSSGLLYLKGASRRHDEVSYHRESLTNFIDFLTIPVRVSTARKVFPVLAMLSAVPLVLLYLPRREKEGREELGDLKRYVVEVKDDTFMKVEVRSREDLEKLLEMVDGPVLHTVDDGYDVYSVISGNTVYEYRAPRRRSDD
ncbi:MAG: DUF5305 domain-containing protein [Thermococci archaeon]|nr:DUF5305 domain-containing protein [Thermococci archaeon]